jgi:hypothetical protein
MMYHGVLSDLYATKLSMPFPFKRNCAGTNIPVYLQHDQRQQNQDSSNTDEDLYTGVSHIIQHGRLHHWLQQQPHPCAMADWYDGYTQQKANLGDDLEEGCQTVFGESSGVPLWVSYVTSGAILTTGTLCTHSQWVELRLDASSYNLTSNAWISVYCRVLPSLQVR